MNILKKMLVLLLSLLIMQGCYSYNTVASRNCDKIPSSEIIYKIEKKNGSITEFTQDTLGRAHIRDSVITGIQNNGLATSIPIKDVKYIYIKHSDVGATLAAIGIGVVVFFVISLTVRHGLLTSMGTGSF